MNKQKAFTLIELMVTVTSVGILASIAIPSYQGSVMKSRRADAQGALLGFANAMERYFTVHNTYLGAGAGGGDTGSPTIFPVTSPVDGGTPYYNLTISSSTASSYTLSAAPIGVQASDTCGTLTITQTGAKSPNTTGCW